MSQSRLIGTIALVTWLLVAVPVLLYHVPDGSLGWQWIAVYLGFGALFGLDLRRPHLLLLALASAAALYLVLLRCNGYEGALLALVAMRLGTRMQRLTGILWILGQTVRPYHAIAAPRKGPLKFSESSPLPGLKR